MNLYAYVGNNPSNWLDPRGLAIYIPLNRGQQEYEAATDYLMQSPDFKERFEKLRDDPEKVYTLDINPDLVKNSYQPEAGGGTIHWNPTLVLWTTDLGTQSPAMGLAHELAGHAYHDYIFGQLDETRTSDAYGNVEDRLTITTIETWIAKALGESVRTDHFGMRLYGANDVTDRTLAPSVFLPQLFQNLMMDLLKRMRLAAKGCEQQP